MTRSPLYAHFDECFEGATVIRSHGSVHINNEVLTCLAYLDCNQRVWFLSTAASQWLTFRLQVLPPACSLGAYVFTLWQKSMCMRSKAWRSRKRVA